MSEKTKPAPAPSPKAASVPGAETRAERLAAALRDNLHRRKAQSRARQVDAGKKPGPDRG